MLTILPAVACPVSSCTWSDVGPRSLKYFNSGMLNAESLRAMVHKENSFDSAGSVWRLGKCFVFDSMEVAMDPAKHADVVSCKTSEEFGDLVAQGLNVLHDSSSIYQNSSTSSPVLSVWAAFGFTFEPPLH